MVIVQPLTVFHVDVLVSLWIPIFRHMNLFSIISSRVPQHHAVCGHPVAARHQRGPLAAAAERRAAAQAGGAVPRLREGVGGVRPRHRPDPGQEGVPAGVRGLL